MAGRVAAAVRALAAGGLAVLLLAGCSGDAGSTETTASCDRGGCTDIPLETIEDVSGLDLPEGTEVVESTYDSFQDWHLGATLLLPEGAEDPVAASEDDWDGVADDEGVHRTVEATTQDGRTTLVIEVFTV
ncbi:hypothetical protein SERN_2805 [Serinibacter arcticus]|uniref:Lipoprotein n=1 Tax=Serinibacter arcticus TaxID=1655435 RepID=A0A4Z1DXA9_9MICO|nr:hypothetical protein SERN_2805 [Serinibacter arcticus]